LGAAGARVAGLKPIESGVADADAGSDAGRLRRASTFHVKPFGVALKAPVSPHRAAKAEGVTLPLGDLVVQVHATLAAADFVVVELPGGLFTPLAENAVNADFPGRLRPDVLLLVAP